jgi:hypothetical protein
MENNRHGFWRNFTIKRWGLNTLYFFSFLLFLDIIKFYVFKVNFGDGLFSAKNLLAILLSSVLMGFLTTLWREKSLGLKLLRSKKSESKT